MRTGRPQSKRLHHLGRLHALSFGARTFALLATLGLGGCEESKTSEESTPAPAPARVQAVTKRAGVSEKDLDGFCDIRSGTLKLPKVIGGKDLTGARWVNLWATWCKSCVKEMPMIEGWKREHGFQLLYISTDEEPEMLDAFLKKHPQVPQTARMSDPESLEQWMADLGLDDGAGLPLHLFVGDDNSVKCARAAAVSEHHLPFVQHLLQ